MNVCVVQLAVMKKYSIITQRTHRFSDDCYFAQGKESPSRGDF